MLGTFARAIATWSAITQPYNWVQSDFDETHYCLEGKIHLVVRDASGRKVILEAKQGEHIYLPAGYDYTLEASGVKTVFFWSSGPSPRAGLVEVPRVQPRAQKPEEVTAMGTQSAVQRNHRDPQDEDTPARRQAMGLSYPPEDDPPCHHRGRRLDLSVAAVVRRR